MSDHQDDEQPTEQLTNVADQSSDQSIGQSIDQSTNNSTNDPAEDTEDDTADQPSDAELSAAVLSLLQGADLSTITPKGIRAAMEKMFNVSMDSRKSFIKQIASEYVEAHPPNDTDEAESEPEQMADEPDVDQEEQDRAMAEALQRELGGRPRRAAAAQPAKPKKKRPALNNPRPKRPPPEVSFSPALLQFLGGEPPLTRGEVSKRIWAYIKENNLQSEKNKRKIVCDEALQTLFGKNCKTIDMFKMTQSLSKHMKSARDIV